MAYIKQRGKFWRVEIRRRGGKPIYRTYDTEAEAIEKAAFIEAELLTGHYVDRREAERTSLRQALERYKRDIVPNKRHPKQEHQRIDRWLKHPLAYRMLSDLRGADFACYRDDRRAQGRAENTIRLELQVISHLFEIARKEWGFETLLNPLKNIRKPGGSRSRDRRLEPGEYDLIRDRLRASDNPFAAPAFDLAIETTLRQGLLFKIRWEWIDFGSRMVRVPADSRAVDNKGVPALLPMSTRTIAVLQAMLPVDSGGVPIDSPTGPVLNTTANAIRCVWKRALADLGIHGLRWHDLRHEATTRLFERGLHPMEVATITGHRSMQMLRRYTHIRPASLLDKLG